MYLWTSLHPHRIVACAREGAMDEKIIYGALATLAVATIIAIVTLAFKSPPAYMKLSKILISLLALSLAAYGGYVFGIDDGGRYALKEIASGTPANEIRFLASAWPFFTMCVSFTIIITLQWFPEWLGAHRPEKQADQ